MNRSIRERTFLLASLLVPALAILCLAWRADAQPGGMRFEKIWRCSKCGGNLGNGVVPPSTCPRCKVKLRAPRNDWTPDSPESNFLRPQGSEPSSEGWSVGRFIAIFVGVAVVAGLGFYVMKDWGA